MAVDARGGSVDRGEAVLAVLPPPFSAGSPREAEPETTQALIRGSGGLCLVGTERRVVLVRCEESGRRAVGIVGEWPYGMLERIEVVAGSHGGRVVIRARLEAEPAVLPLEATAVLEALPQVAALAWRIRGPRGT